MAVILVVVAGCTTATVRRPDGELRVLTEAGKAAYVQGLPVKAAVLYVQAYQRGMLIDESMEAGRSAYNAALCHLAVNQLTEAKRMLREARRLLVADGVAMARVDMAEAEIALRGGNKTEAVDFARRVLAACAGASERCQAAVLLAEIALGDQNRAAALSWYKVARKGGSDGLAPLLAARREGVGARLIQAGVLRGCAGERYLSQAAHLRDGGAHGDMAVALMQAGDAFKAAGLFPEAFSSYQRAVNIFVALDDKASAVDGVVQAEALGNQLDGAVYAEQIRLLRELVGQ